jgi:hypothetical protein
VRSVLSDLESYRRDAEEFASARERAIYLHHAGHTPDLPLAALHERFAHLFSVANAAALLEEAGAGPDTRRRSRRALAAFAVDGLMERATLRETEELARREAAATITIDGAEVGYRRAAALLANEPDAERRAVLERARLEVVATRLTPLLRESWETRHALARELGAASYRDLYERLAGVDLGALQRQGQALLAETDDLYAAALNRELRAIVGIGLEAARRSDVPRLMRAAPFDAWFPADGMIPALEETLAGLGVDLRRQTNLVLDTEPRPTKDPRAFCAPVRIPGEVYLVIAPVGGVDDYRALFHEAGHAEHFAGASRTLPFEFRYGGDAAVTETYAFLFQHLTDDPVWLERVLGFRDSRDHLRLAATRRLWQYRRYAAKLAYEIQLHDAPALEGMPELYSELLSAATLLVWPREPFLDDVDPGFYAASYLRAWALEASLRRHLREWLGTRWFQTRKAGNLLRELWHEGQRLSAEEVASELDLPDIDLSVLVEEVAAILA